MLLNNQWIIEETKEEIKKAEDEPEFFVDMVYGQPEKNNHWYLGLKTETLMGRKMVYLVVWSMTV